MASIGDPNLPSIETLTAQSDYTLFLKPNVPAEMQRRALRKLWLSDPIFAYRDGLSYDEDYTRPGDQDITTSIAALTVSHVSLSCEAFKLPYIAYPAMHS